MKNFQIFVVFGVIFAVNSAPFNLVKAKNDVILKKNPDGLRQVVELESFSRPATLVFDKDILAEISMDGKVVSTQPNPTKWLEIDLSKNVGQKGIPIVVRDLISGEKIEVLFSCEKLMGK